MRNQALFAALTALAFACSAAPPSRDQPAYDAAALLRDEDFCWRVGFATAAAEYQQRIGVPREVATRAPLYVLLATTDAEFLALQDAVVLVFEQRHWTSGTSLIQSCNAQGRRQVVDSAAGHMGLGPVGAAARHSREEIFKELAPVLLPP
jgi:hypothetical protein